MAQGLYIKEQRKSHILSWVFWIVVLGLIGLCVWFGYRYFTAGDLPLGIAIRALAADPRVDEKPVTKQQIEIYNVPADHPRYISIPSLGIANTRIFPVGVTANNQLDSPKNISDAAWYTGSSKPGEGGAILMDGHNGGISRDGIFAKINTLTAGSEIIVERGDGQKFTYSVVENQSMYLEDVNKTGMQKMMQSAEPDKEGLNLITCDGKWVPKYQQFDRRILLRAVRV